MARKSKLAGEQLEKFMKERGRGVPLRELAAKYGLTIARLSQIYRKEVLVRASAAMPMGGVHDSARDISEHDTGWYTPVSHDEPDVSEPGNPDNPRSDYAV